MKTILLINPHAGKQLILKALPEVETVFRTAGWEISTICTENVEQADRAISLALEKEPDRLVCCGGDGTLNQVVGEVLRLGADTVLGYIPAGTTNDFANSLDLPRDPVEAAEVAAGGVPVLLDAGRFGDRTFIYGAYFGAFTHSSYSTDQTLKNTLGHLAYVVEGIRELPKLQSYRLRAETEEGRSFEGEYIFGAVSNSLSFGGIIKLNPELVDFADGKLELMLVKKPRNLHELNRILASLFSGKYEDELITFVSTSEVIFTCEEAMDWSLDGEYASGDKVVKIGAIPGAYRLCCRG